MPLFKLNGEKVILLTNGLKFASFLGCLSIFVVQVSTLFEHFKNSSTVSAITFERPLTKKFPSLSICPYEVHKVDRYPLSEEEYEETEFKMEDILSADALLKISNVSEWRTSRTIGPYVGTCFTIQYLPEATSFYFEFQIEVLKKHNLQVYLHNPGDEFWLFLEVYPYDLMSHYVNLGDDPRISFIDIRVKESKYFTKNTDKKPCKIYSSNAEFVACARKAIVSRLAKNMEFNCTTVFSTFLTKLPLPRCPTKQMSQDMDELVEESFYTLLRDPHFSGCPLPCNQSFYPSNFFIGHKHFFGKNRRPPDRANVIIFYESLVSEIITETFRVDLGALFSSIGGNLGLFLGFSCFKALLTLIDWFKKKIFDQ